MNRVLLLTTILVVMFLKGSFSKPTEITAGSNTLDAITLIASDSTLSDVKREQRSPQYGYYNYNPRSSQSYPVRNHRYRPSQANGCRGYSCGGGFQPNYASPGGASFATALAGSIGGSGWPFGGQSQSNAQSASFNFGPFSGSISSAQSSSFGRK